MTENEKGYLAALYKRVFDGEELKGQFKDLHDHLKAKDKDISIQKGIMRQSF